MYYGLSLHNALTEALTYLDLEMLQSTLDQAVADTKGEYSPQALAANILDRLGLIVEKLPFSDLENQLHEQSITLGVSDNHYILVKQKTNRKYAISEWVNSSGNKKYTARKIPYHEHMTWLTIRNGCAFASLANPGGTMGAWERLFKFIRLEKREISAVTIYAATLGTLSLVTPIATQALVNTIAFGAIMQPLIILVIMLFIGLGLVATLNILQAYLVEIFQRRIIINAAEDLGVRLPRVAEKSLDRNNLVEASNRFLDVITIQKSVAELLLTGLALILQTGVGFVLLSFYHPFLLLFALIIITILGLVILMGKGGTASAILESKAKFSLAGWLDELARNPQRFHGGDGRVLAAQELAQRAHIYVKARRHHFRRVFALIIGGNLLQALAIVGLLAIGGWLVIERQLTLGQLVAAELVVSGIAFGLGKLGKLAEKTFDLVASLDKLGTLLDLPLKPLGKDVLEESHRGVRLEVENLKVGYGKDAPLGATISFNLEPGEKALIEGASSSGKSAILEVLAGWRALRDGIVRWDGHSQLNNDDCTQAIWMLRRGEIIGGTIMTNLRLANASLSTEQARNAVETVGLQDAIERQPRGYETSLLPSGAPLSPSEVQRLMLAQALIAQPRLLVIDEALDGLEKSHSHLLEALLGKETPWTAVVTSCDPAVRGFLSHHFHLEKIAPQQ